MMTPELDALLTHYGYWLMAFGAIIEGETFLIAGGIAAHKGYFHLEGLILLAVVGSTLHDLFFFIIGRLGGHALVKRKPQLYARSENVLRYFDRYGVWLIIGLRFAYGLRTIIPAVLGMTTLSTKKFLFFDLIGGILWSCAFILGGYFFGVVLDQFIQSFEDYAAWVFFTVLGASLLVVLFLVYFLWRRSRMKKENPPLPLEENGGSAPSKKEGESTSALASCLHGSKEVLNSEEIGKARTADLHEKALHSDERDAPVKGKQQAQKSSDSTTQKRARIVKRKKLALEGKE